ncbi:hypothetical protein BG003_010219 [Podila horticola]|nr:hypothetical protein BG003_010219 [Podila horticola]
MRRFINTLEKQSISKARTKLQHDEDYHDLLISSDSERRETLTRIYEETRFPAKDPSSHPITSSSTILHDVNILVIGDAQSGKSTLIEVMKMYSSLVFDTNVEPFRRGENGADEILTGSLLLTDFHTYEICKSQEKKGDFAVFNLP